MEELSQEARLKKILCGKNIYQVKYCEAHLLSSTQCSSQPETVGTLLVVSFGLPCKEVTRRRFRHQTIVVRCRLVFGRRVPKITGFALFGKAFSWNRGQRVKAPGRRAHTEN